LGSASSLNRDPTVQYYQHRVLVSFIFFAILATSCATSPIIHIVVSFTIAIMADQSTSAAAPPNTSAAAQPDEDLDNSIEGDIDMAGAEVKPAEDGPVVSELDPAAVPERVVPTKKDTSLREFLGKMDDYAPIVRATIRIAFELC
jgi:hypothetical protein